MSTPNHHSVMFAVSAYTSYSTTKKLDLNNCKDSIVFELVAGHVLWHTWIWLGCAPCSMSC